MRYNAWGLKQHKLKVNGRAWFHLYIIRRASGNGKQVKNSKWNICFHWKIEPVDSQWKHIFILNILLATRYSKLGCADANEIKQNHSPVVALPIENRERNLTKSILARVCTLNVCGYSTRLRSVQWKVHKNTLLKQDIFLLWGGTNLHECLEWTEICS